MSKYSPLKTILILVPMVFAIALAMDVYITVLPDMREALHTTQQMVQVTVSLCLVVTGVGQLYLGPLTDQRGRFRV
ncbi:Bcr/CflA family drug resistance efflux transporter, partial [Francisella tularensis subsp. holarctica]|nr:Bcr/CflA family drug resistance efflux transporter [Francisella tularensis subsp. holarctica]